MQLQFKAIAEDAPGVQWQAHAHALWPSYQDWWQRDGSSARPTYMACRKALREHMPELVPTWQKLCELLGGSDAQARFLSMWCPPPYITGCTQAVWLGAGGELADPAQACLLRNYDFSPHLFEGVWLATRWAGQRVVAMSDCLWGVLDGINESGLAISLSFGGRTVSGPGFGIPLVMRYVLEVAQNVPEAVALLQRLPHHMSYSITMLDRAARWATVFVAPDRPTEVVHRRSVSNIQHAVEWPQHDKATNASLRAQTLAQALATEASATDLRNRMLEPPLWQSAFSRGYGTLYTAVYAPVQGQVALYWPQQAAWEQGVAAFQPGERAIEMVWADVALSEHSPHTQSGSAVDVLSQRWIVDTPTSFS